MSTIANAPCRCRTCDRTATRGTPAAETSADPTLCPRCEHYRVYELAGLAGDYQGADSPVFVEPAAPLSLRGAYYAAVAAADEALTDTRLDAYGRLSARNEVHAARTMLDEDNFLRAAIAVDADDEGRWDCCSTLPEVVEYEAPAAPKAPSPLARRVNVYALALLDDAPINPALSITCGEMAGYELDLLERRAHTNGDARRVESILSSACGVSL